MLIAYIPQSLSRLHPVFPVVKLTLAPHDSFNHQNRAPPPPEIVDDEEHYEVEETIDSRYHRNKLQYLVKWKRFGYEENSWTNEGDIFAPRLVRDFHQNHPGAPRCIRKIHFDSVFSTASRSLRPGGGNVRGPFISLCCHLFALYFPLFVPIFPYFYMPFPRFSKHLSLLS